jgi:hypothetical protein
VNAVVNVKTFKSDREDKELRLTDFVNVSISERQTVVCSELNWPLNCQLSRVELSFNFNMFKNSSLV